MGHPGVPVVACCSYSKGGSTSFSGSATRPGHRSRLRRSWARSIAPRSSARTSRPETGLSSSGRLFERRDSARRLVDAGLLDLQNDLIERVQRLAAETLSTRSSTSGCCEERRVIGPESPHRPPIHDPTGAGRRHAPGRVFESIRLRWQYLRVRRSRIVAAVVGRLPPRGSDARRGCFTGFEGCWRLIWPYGMSTPPSAVDWRRPRRRSRLSPRELL